MKTCKELKCICFECQTRKKDRPKCGMCPGRIAEPDCTGFIVCVKNQKLYQVDDSTNKRN